MDVFPDYKPESPIVRVIASDIRNKFLPSYYKDFPDDPIGIDLLPTKPGGSYRIAFSYRHDPECLRLYGRGMYHLAKGSFDDCQQAAIDLAKAVDLDPHLAGAHAAAADAFFRCAMFCSFGRGPFSVENVVGNTLGNADERDYYVAREELSNAQLILRCQAFAESAIKQNPQSWNSYIILGASRACQYDWENAKAAFQAALGVSKSDTIRHPLYTAYLIAIGHVEEAYELVRTYIDKHPFDPLVYGLYRLFLYANERFAMHICGANGSVYDCLATAFQYVKEEVADEHWLGGLVEDLHNADRATSLVQPFGVYTCDEVRDSPGGKSTDEETLDVKIFIVGSEPYTKEEACMRLGEINFFPCGIEELGRARLKDPQKFFREDDAPTGELYEYLDRTIEWSGYKGVLRAALAYVALAQMKLHGGIPKRWVAEIPHPLMLRSGCWEPKDENGYHRLQDRAIEALSRACDGHEPLMAWLHLWPFLKSLRREPGFRPLIDRMKLPAPALRAFEEEDVPPLLGYYTGRPRLWPNWADWSLP